ncbi:MAG: PilN domain-containing protein [bacterium]|nr:PilN domain-containing protein [bacterium]
MNLPLFKKNKGKNINLLPEETAGSVTFKRDIIFALLTPVATLVLLGLIFATLTILEQKEKFTARNIQKKIEEQTTLWQQFAASAKTASNVKDAISTHQQSTQQNDQAVGSITSIQSVVPNGVVITKLDIDKEGKTSVDGSASDPRTIFQFVETLNSKSETFSDLKLENIGFSSQQAGGSGTQYNFSFSLVVKTE